MLLSFWTSFVLFVCVVFVLFFNVVVVVVVVVYTFFFAVSRKNNTRDSRSGMCDVSTYCPQPRKMTSKNEVGTIPLNTWAFLPSTTRNTTFDTHLFSEMPTQAHRETLVSCMLAIVYGYTRYFLCVYVSEGSVHCNTSFVTYSTFLVCATSKSWFYGYCSLTLRPCSLSFTHRDSRLRSTPSYTLGNETHIWNFDEPYIYAFCCGNLMWPKADLPDSKSSSHNAPTHLPGGRCLFMRRIRLAVKIP